MGMDETARTTGEVVPFVRFVHNVPIVHDLNGVSG